MDIRLTDEQRMLADMAGSLAADIAGKWDLGRGPATAGSSAPDADAWRMLVDAGLLELRLGEDGAAAASCLDVCLAIEQFGRHAVPAPVAGATILLEQLRCHGADEESLRQLASGRLRLAPTLRADLGGFADDAGDAVAFDVAGSEGAVVVGDTGADVLALTGERGVDLTRPFADLDAAAGPRSTIRLNQSRTDDATVRATGFALAILSADLLGVMHGAFDTAVTHARSRIQFGRPIASFQAIQHLAADALVSIEASRSAVWYAAWAVDALPPRDLLVAARTAKAFCSKAAIEVVETAVQIVGGIGMTWEYPAHVWLRRAHADRQILGTEHAQYAALAAAEFGQPVASKEK